MWLDNGLFVRLPVMAIFYFDTRDDDTFTQDDEGVDLPDLEAAKAQAALSLAELAKDVLPGADRRGLAVEVRDQSGPLLKAYMRFEAIILAR
jgi:hypothetical protein